MNTPDLITLLSIPSTTDNISACQQTIDFFTKKLSQFNIRTFRSNNHPSILISNQSTDQFRIILNGHLDVVSAPNNLFQPQIDQDRLIARGAQDMKASCFIMAEVFQNQANQIKYPIALLFTTDEETGGFHGTKHILEQGITSNFVIAGESTNFNINDQSKGIIWANITTSGHTAHGAYLWDGDNAITKMNSIITQILDTYPTPNQESWTSTINISQIHSNNQSINKVPDHCTLTLDIRYIPEDKEDILDFLNKLTIQNKSELRIKFNEPAQLTDPEHPDITKLHQTILQHHPTSQFIKQHGSSDVRFFTTHNIPAVCFGPIGEGLHQDHEWISLQSLDTFKQILTTYLLNLNG